MPLARTVVGQLSQHKGEQKSAHRYKPRGLWVLANAAGIVASSWSLITPALETEKQWTRDDGTISLAQ